MSWSVVPFGKYEGKTFPEILVRDADWFFWVVPHLYGKLAEEAEELARKAPSKFQIRIGEHKRSTKERCEKFFSNDRNLVDI